MRLNDVSIGIRKVMGADLGNIVSLLSKDFILLVLIAILIATPISWYVMPLVGRIRISDGNSPLDLRAFRISGPFYCRIDD